MADYYPLISRAVAGLEKNTGEARRTLYERARTALVDQLRGATPALTESDITRERLALEEAIRKVEAESARRMRFETPKPDVPTPKSSSTDAVARRRGENRDSARTDNNRTDNERGRTAAYRNREADRPTDRARDLDTDYDRGDGTPRRDRNPVTSAITR